MKILIRSSYLVDRLSSDASVCVNVLVTDSLGISVGDPRHLALTGTHVGGRYVDTGPWRTKYIVLEVSKLQISKEYYTINISQKSMHFGNHRLSSKIRTRRDEI